MTGPDRADLVLSAEQVQIGTEWTVAGGLRFRKRIVTDTRTVEVVVRREELVVEVRDAVVTNPDGRTWAGTAQDGPVSAVPVATAPLVLLLHEEVPEVHVATRAYEQVTVHSVLVTDDVLVRLTTAREEAVVESTTQLGTA